MNILFLTVSSEPKNINEGGIYAELMRYFKDQGHSVYIIFPYERRLGIPTKYEVVNDIYLLGVKTLNVTKTNVIEKGIGQILLEYQFKKALKKYWNNIKFDLILYSTPPITFTNVIRYAKLNNPNATTYLLLKDIFPQNAVDLGMMSTDGIKGLLYKSFRKKEKELYRISDYIGCMSPANVEYILKHNPEIDPLKVEIAPNSCDIPASHTQDDSIAIKEKYGLPLDKPIFIYGGNMGKPQGILFLIQCLDAVKDRNDCHFVVVGDGTDYPRLHGWNMNNKPNSVSVFRKLPKKEYDALARACDVGLIFLDYRFTIPNFPSRLLSYLTEKKPIIAVTDQNCDMGTIAENNQFGYFCPSNSVDTFVNTVNRMLNSDIKQMGENGYKYYLNNYTTEHTYNAIMKHLK